MAPPPNHQQLCRNLLALDHYPSPPPLFGHIPQFQKLILKQIDFKCLLAFSSSLSFHFLYSAPLDFLDIMYSANSHKNRWPIPFGCVRLLVVGHRTIIINLWDKSLEYGRLRVATSLLLDIVSSGGPACSAPMFTVLVCGMGPIHAQTTN